jgi:hypothetical protein
LKSFLLIFSLFINIFFINAYAAETIPDDKEAYPEKYDKEDFDFSYLTYTCSTIDISKLTPDSPLQIICHLYDINEIVTINLPVPTNSIITNFRYFIKNDTHSTFFKHLNFSGNYIFFSKLFNKQVISYLQLTEKALQSKYPR